MTHDREFDPLHDHQIVGFATAVEAYESASQHLPIGTPVLIFRGRDGKVSWSYSRDFFRVPEGEVRAVVTGVPLTKAT